MDLPSLTIAETPPAINLSVSDAMTFYGVSRSTIYRRIKDGTLTAYRFGPRIFRLDAAELAAAFQR